MTANRLTVDREEKEESENRFRLVWTGFEQSVIRLEDTVQVHGFGRGSDQDQDSVREQKQGLIDWQSVWERDNLIIIAQKS